MSKSKKTVITQETLDTQAEFDTFFAKEGLKVIDAHSGWCGPCKALAGFIKTLKTELSDPILHFATANADNIELLAAYRGTSEPITLVFGGQTLVNVIRGANSPLIETEVKSALVVEHDAIENGTARVEFVDVSLAAAAAEAATPVEDAAPEEPKVVKTYTLAVIKPDVCAAEGKADAIFADIAEAGFKVSKMDDVEYTEETAKAAFAGADDEFVASVTSGPCKTLVLCNSKVNAVSSWLSILTPAAEPEAKLEGEEEATPEGDEEAKPEGEGGAEAEEEEAKVVPSLLEKHGLEPGSLYGSATAEAATAEITAAFPEWAAENLGKEESTEEEAAAPSAEGDGGGDTAAPAGGDAAAPAEAEAEAAPAAVAEGDCGGNAAAPAEGDAAAPAEAEPASPAAAADAEAAPAPATEAEAPAAGDAAAAPAEAEAAAPAEAEPAAPAADADAAPAAEAEAAPTADEPTAAGVSEPADAEAAPVEEATAV